MLLKNHVAVQNFRLETMRQDPKGLVFTMNQMSLASYAKLGGRLWLLGAEQTVAHEQVIGVGSHVASDSRIGGRTGNAPTRLNFTISNSMEIGPNRLECSFNSLLDNSVKQIRCCKSLMGDGLPIPAGVCHSTISGARIKPDCLIARRIARPRSVIVSYGSPSRGRGKL